MKEAAAPEAQTPAAKSIPFDSARAWEHLRKQVGLGPRPSGTPALVQNRKYIVDQLKAIGIESREQAFIGMTPLGEVSMANVVATIPGKRSDRIAIASHFDTKLFREFRFVGANDGASSTAALLELARVLKAQPHRIGAGRLIVAVERVSLSAAPGGEGHCCHHHEDPHAHAAVLPAYGAHSCAPMSERPPLG